MNRVQIRCPCCGNIIEIDLVSGKISTDFFNGENEEVDRDELSKLGYEFGITKEVNDDG